MSTDTGRLSLHTDKQHTDSFTHGRRKREVCRGSDTPTIDIDMYIPLEKPNT